MKCGHCGANNAKEANFCESCGRALNKQVMAEDAYDLDKTQYYEQDAYDLDKAQYDAQDIEAYEREFYSEKPSKRKWIVLGVVAAFVLIFAVGAIAFSGFREGHLENKAEVAIENEDYDEAYAAYRKLASIAKEKEDKAEAREMAKDVKAYLEAQERLEDGALAEALRRYVEIKGHDNDLEDAAEDGIDRVATRAEDKISALKAAGEYQQAEELASSLVSIDPANDRLGVLKAGSEQARAEAEKAVADEKIAVAKEQKKAADAQANAQKKAKRASEANRILYTTQYVTAGSANVRTGPGKNYPIAYVLDRGAAVYVIDTQSDAKRTWCNIGDGWISYRTLNGEFN